MSLVLKKFNNLTMYRLVIYLLIFILLSASILSFFNYLTYSPWEIIIQSALFLVLCRVFDILLSKIFKISANLESAAITGLILSLIIGPFNLPIQWLPISIISFLAILSKYIFVFKGSHIFNPVAFGVLVSSLLFGYSASWWVGSKEMIAIVLLSGLIIAWRIKRFHLIFSFLIVYLFLFLFDILIQGGDWNQVYFFLENIIIYSPLIFFAFIMVSEPITSPGKKWKRVSFASFIGLILFIIQKFTPGVFVSFELSLVLGNIFGRIIDNNFKQSFVLNMKEKIGIDIMNFEFKPKNKFKFEAGQYLEYTLDHKRPDRRGVRRFFTIASSPTEKNILLTTKFFEKNTSFKNSLRNIKEGDKIFASKLSGDFILPKNKNKKLVFIAGGVGITPFRSMVKYLLDKNEKRDIILFYGEKECKKIIFNNVFKEAEKKLNLKRIYILSNEDKEGQEFRRGVIGKDVLLKEAPDYIERMFFISGPPNMVKGVYKILISIGVSKNNIKKDYFEGY